MKEATTPKSEKIDGIIGDPKELDESIKKAKAACEPFLLRVCVMLCRLGHDDTSANGLIGADERHRMQ